MPAKIPQPASAKPSYEEVVAYYSQGRFQEGFELAKKALAYEPHNLVILNAAATCAFNAGLLTQAEEYWKKVAVLHPQYADAHFNLGALYIQMNRLSDSEASYRKAVAIDPRHKSAINNLGVMLQQQKRYDEAESFYRSALVVSPDFVDVRYNLAMLYQEVKRYEEAEACYRLVVKHKPDHPGAYNNLGVMFNAMNRHEDSEQAYHKAIEVNPGYAVAYKNLGLLLQALKRFEDAEVCFRNAYLVDPNYADANWSLGMCLLYQGKFTEGWQCYESRYDPSIEGRTIVPPECDFPQWRGESLQGKSIAVWHEQALGDDLQFCRFLPVLKALGARKVTFVCKPALKSLLQTLSGVDEFISKDDAASVPLHDYWVFFFSIPTCLKTTVDTVPAKVPYLFAKDVYQQPVAAKLKNIDGFKIGICWKGSPLYLADSVRSPGLEPFSRLFKVPGAKFFTLLQASRDEFLRAAGAAGVDFGHELDEATPAFEETAALVSQLDLVISSDTSIVHLAGALGKPVWVLLPYVADWRWMIDREDTPWYPNMRLIRQSERGNWTELFDRVASRLEQVIADQAPVLWPLGADAVAVPPVATAGGATAATPLRLNLGSGKDRIPDWLNVDHDPACYPDSVVNLEAFPWPWPDNGVAAIRLHYVLERLGESRAVYMKLLQEIYRVCLDGAQIHIRALHPRHDQFIADPNHVRPITEEGLQLLDQALNRTWMAEGTAKTPLGMQWGVDFRIERCEYVWESSFQDKLQRGAVTREQMLEMMRLNNNICHSIDVTLRVIKGGNR